MSSIKAISFPAILLALIFPLALQAELRVSSFFGDQMVLQRDQDLPVWGKASPGSEVTVTFRKDSVTAEADESGEWMVELPPQDLGAPSTLQIESEGESIAFQDVLVGEVWICSGQSNMQWPVSRAADPENEIANANYPSIRLFDVPSRYATSPQEDVDATWEVCSPETVGSFSAVGYYFGRELREELQVPIGLVSTNWGGTPAEAWTPMETLRADPAYAELVTLSEEAARLLVEQPELQAELQRNFDTFTKGIDRISDSPPPPDPGAFDPDLSLEDAAEILPDTRFLQETDGLVQVRQVFALTPSQAETANARIRLGQIDNYDITWINGVEVGRTGPEVGAARREFRDYEIPAGVLRPGENVVLIQIVDVRNTAILGGNVETPEIHWPGGDSLPLSGPWEMQIVEDLGPRPSTLDSRMKDMGSFLWNGMVSPLVPAPFRGVIWYQGESNTGRPEQYRTLFPDMIESWREAWGRGDFPFYFVQLANFSGRDGWPELREAQRETLCLPNTGMAVTIDIGDPDDIHPKNKQDVGKRLALWALAETYGKTDADGSSIPHSGPLFTKAVIDDGEIRLQFDHVYQGLQTSDGDPLKGFVIAGADGTFLPANARIDGEEIVVSHPDLENPRFVRYAWDINPEANLTNSVGLPASPFRTDDGPFGSVE